MTKPFAALFFAVAISASAAQWVTPQGDLVSDLPKRIETAQGIMDSPDWPTLAAQGWREATEQDIADAQAAAELAAQAAEAARIKALAQAYGGAVTALQTYLSQVGWSIPCDSAAVTADLIGRALAGLLTAEQKEAKANVADLYMLLTAQGVSNPDIAAIWAAIAP